MADGQGSQPRGKPPLDIQAPDLQAIARDWVTIWQSELSAMATDRELQDGWVRLVELWADAAERATRLFPLGRRPSSHDEPSGHTGSTAPARAASVMAPPDDRDAAIRRLAERVAELERRLAENERCRYPGAGNGTDT